MPTKCRNCSKRGTFGYHGEKARYCSIHRDVDMIYLNGAICLNCHKSANFGVYGNKPQYCLEHKKEGMTNIRTRKCLDCSTQATFGMLKIKLRIANNIRKKE